MMDEITKKVADALVARVEDTARRLRGANDALAAARPAPGRWCGKEMLGHLVDSATNNLQRFVRAQLAAELAFPGYEQDAWVSAQGYAEASWRDLVDLWRLANLHLARVMRRIPQEKLATPCRIGGRDPVTLGWIVEDYLRHFEHHVKALLETLGV
jgi:hypothetical protein